MYNEISSIEKMQKDGALDIEAKVSVDGNKMTVISFTVTNPREDANEIISELNGIQTEGYYSSSLIDGNLLLKYTQIFYVGAAAGKTGILKSALGNGELRIMAALYKLNSQE